MVFRALFLLTALVLVSSPCIPSEQAQQRAPVPPQPAPKTANPWRGEKVVGDTTLFPAQFAKIACERIAYVKQLKPPFIFLSFPGDASISGVKWSAGEKTFFACFGVPSPKEPSIADVVRKFGRPDMVVDERKSDRRLPVNSSINYYGRLGLAVSGEEKKVRWIVIESEP